MHLIQIFLPTYGNAGEKFPALDYRQVSDELIKRFGGLTAYARAPAHGLWQPDEGQPVQDDLVIYEVMAEELDQTWWRSYKTTLEKRFRQDAIIVRAQTIDLL